MQKDLTVFLSCLSCRLRSRLSFNCLLLPRLSCLYYFSCIFCLSSLSCCTYYKPTSPAYKTFYAHLATPVSFPPATWTSNYFLIIYVNARHLDYTDNYSFLNTIISHPSDGSRNRDVGHAWIYLQGILNGQQVYLCGGHTGETGLFQAKYFDGIMNYIDFGYDNPTKKQMAYPRYEPNPVKYLWEIQKDGYFEWGSGYHRPTFAAKIDLTPEQFERIADFVQKYDYANYALVGNQCSSFAAQVASLGGLDLECEVTIAINKDLYLRGERIRFWEDPCYSRLTLSTPDIIERSLMKAVIEGKAERL